MIIDPWKLKRRPPIVSSIEPEAIDVLFGVVSGSFPFSYDVNGIYSFEIDVEAVDISFGVDEIQFPETLISHSGQNAEAIEMVFMVESGDLPETLLDFQVQEPEAISISFGIIEGSMYPLLIKQLEEIEVGFGVVGGNLEDPRLNVVFSVPHVEPDPNNLNVIFS